VHRVPRKRSAVGPGPRRGRRRPPRARRLASTPGAWRVRPSAPCVR